MRERFPTFLGGLATDNPGGEAVVVHRGAVYAPERGGYRGQLISDNFLFYKYLEHIRAPPIGDVRPGRPLTLRVEGSSPRPANALSAGGIPIEVVVVNTGP